MSPLIELLPTFSYLRTIMLSAAMGVAIGFALGRFPRLGPSKIASYCGVVSRPLLNTRELQWFGVLRWPVRCEFYIGWLADRAC